MTVVEDFEKWAAGRAGLEPDVVRTVVDYKASYCGNPDPQRFDCGDLETVLLGVVVRKVMADEEYFASVVPTLEAYLRFLDQRKRLSRKGEALDHLLGELKDIGEEFLDAVRDPGRAGVGKAIMSAMAPEGFAGGQAELTAMMEQFNALPFEERDRILAGSPPVESGWLEGMAFPAIRRPSTPDLVAAAGGTVTLQRLARLAEFVGQGRVVTATEVLRPADAQELVAEFWPDEVAAPLRSALEHAGLNGLWTVATILDWVTVDGTKARAGAAIKTWTGPDDDVRLDLWRQVMFVVMDQGHALAHDRTHSSGEVDALVTEVMVVLYTTLYLQPAVDVVDVVATVLDESGADDPTVAALVPLWVGDQLRHLEELGMLVLDGTEAAATPLGRVGLNRVLVGQGAEALLIDAESLTATALLDRPEIKGSDADDVTREWVASRAPATVTADLLDSCVQLGTPYSRIAAADIISRFLLTTQLRPVIEKYAGDPLLGPHLRRLLLGDDSAPSISDANFLLADSLASEFADLEPPIHSDDGTPELWDLAEALVSGPAPALIPHPDLLVVLDAITSGHPRNRVRKLAGKAAHKFRRRLIS